MIDFEEKNIKEILENDGVIAFVTDTVWGLGCLPTSKKAVEKINRVFNLNISVDIKPHLKEKEEKEEKNNEYSESQRQNN